MVHSHPYMQRENVINVHNKKCSHIDTKNCVVSCSERTVKAHIQQKVPLSDKEVKNVLKMGYEYSCFSRLAYGRVKIRPPDRSGTRPSFFSYKVGLCARIQITRQPWDKIFLLIVLS